MIEKYIFLQDNAEKLYKEDNILVNKTYDFGEEAGSAAKVSYDDEEDIETVKQELSSVTGVVDEIEGGFVTRTAPTEVDERVATIEEIEKLHTLGHDGFTGEGINVVVMDSGIDEEHGVFNNTDIDHVDVTGRGDGDEVGHGTAVAGQIVRVAPDVNLTSLRIFGSSGRATFSTILKAYEWLFQHSDEIDIVNMSWGASRKVDQLDQLQNKLVEQDVRDVTAAGNTASEGGSPATAEKAFSAGACTESGEMAPFSSYNPNWDNPDVSTVGVNNRLAQASGTSMGGDLRGPWVMASGTSFAAPELTGSVARFLEGNPDEDLEELYEETGDDIEEVEKDGYGLLNHSALMSNAPEDGAPPETQATVWTLWSDNRDMIHLNKDWLSDGEFTVSKVADTDDRIVLEFLRN